MASFFLIAYAVTEQKEDVMEKRLGFVGIILERREGVADKVNALLSEYGSCVVARLGVPYKERDCSVITVIVDTTTNMIGELTGKLGSIPGVSVKSALSKM